MARTIDSTVGGQKEERITRDSTYELDRLSRIHNGQGQVIVPLGINALLHHTGLQFLRRRPADMSEKYGPNAAAAHGKGTNQKKAHT